MLKMMMILMITMLRSKTCIMASYRPAVREAPLCQLDWELHFTGDGVVTEVPELLDKVFRGGVEENIRPEVREGLCGCVVFSAKPFSSTTSTKILNLSIRHQLQNILVVCL